VGDHNFLRVTTPVRTNLTTVTSDDPHTTLEGYYGLGIMSGRLAGWVWFGHNGAFQGYN